MNINTTIRGQPSLQDRRHRQLESDHPCPFAHTVPKCILQADNMQLAAADEEIHTLMRMFHSSGIYDVLWNKFRI